MKLYCRCGAEPYKTRHFKAESDEWTCTACGGRRSQFDPNKPRKALGGSTFTDESPAEKEAREYFNQVVTDFGCFFKRFRKGHTCAGFLDARPWPIPNVWLGVSIENRRFVHRADLLRETPAAVRFISAEPLLGPLVHNPFYPQDWRPLNLVGIDWLIAGGESGPAHRRIDREWVRDLLCATRNQDPFLRTAFFFKQWGGRTPKAGGRELDGRTWSEWPAALEAAR